MMQLHILPGGELPIYRQIMHQVVDAIACGRLRGGEQLPSHRDLAEQLVISPLTVKKAYDELERDALIETRRGRGTYVRAAASADRGLHLDRLRDSARRLVSLAHLGGVPLRDVVSLIEETDAALHSERGARQGANHGSENDANRQDS